MKKRAMAPRPKQGMRIAELAKRSGTTKETIHFYLREGLLKKPRKTSRNMAYYGEDHLEQLKLIKRLRSESYLPLNVIKKVMKQGKLATSARRLDLSGELFGQGARATFEPLTRKEFAERSGLSEGKVAAYEERGLLRPGKVGRVKRYGYEDVRIAEILKEAEEEAGEGEGLMIERFSIIEAHLAALVREEVAHFFSRVVTGGDPKNALELLQGGRETIGRFMAIARARRLREEVEAMMPAIEGAVKTGQSESFFLTLEPKVEEEVGATAHRAALIKASGDGEPSTVMAALSHMLQLGDGARFLEEVGRLKDAERERLSVRLMTAEALFFVERFDESFELVQRVYEEDTGDEVCRPFLEAFWGTLVLVRIRQKFTDLQSSTELVGYLSRAFAAFDAARKDEGVPALLRARTRLYLGRACLATPSFLGVQPQGEKDLMLVLSLLDELDGPAPGVLEMLEFNAAYFLSKSALDPQNRVRYEERAAKYSRR